MSLSKPTIQWLILGIDLVRSITDPRVHTAYDKWMGISRLMIDEGRDPTQDEIDLIRASAGAAHSKLQSFGGEGEGEL